MWTDDEVLAKAASWFWTPFDAVVVESGGYTMDIVQGKATFRAWPDRDPVSVIAEAVELAKAHGAERVVFATHGRTRPPGLADELQRQGAEMAEQLDISAFPLGSGLPALDAPDLEVRTLTTTEDLLLVYEVDADSFGYPMPSEQFRRADEQELARQNALGGARETLRVLAVAHGRPVGSAGLTFDDGVAKLWAVA